MAQQAAPAAANLAADSSTPTPFQLSRGRFIERLLIVHGLMRRLRERVPSTQLKAIAARLFHADEKRAALRYTPEQLAEVGAGGYFFELLGTMEKSLQRYATRAWDSGV